MCTINQHSDYYPSKAGCQKIFREKVSGFNRQRPEFQRMLDQIRPGDVIVVWKLDRLARSTRDLLAPGARLCGGRFLSLGGHCVALFLLSIWSGLFDSIFGQIRPVPPAAAQRLKQRGGVGIAIRLRLHQVEQGLLVGLLSGQ